MATASKTLFEAADAADEARAALEAYLAADRARTQLRFITCGSVDDGKSTLIGRLLYDSKLLFEDQLAALHSDSRRCGTQGGELDFALLVDGLGAEREQGITIDVAYRFFATARRRFIVADTPGHEQYTRNMATGASTADLAVILVDAEKGILTQTRRHSYLAKLLGIGELVLAVNKMDLIGYDQARFEAIVADYRAFAAEAGIERFTAIPVSGLRGDNVTRRSTAMAWHDGPALLEHLETVPVAARPDRAPLRMAVQWVNRPHAGFRGYAGRIASGVARPGDPILVLPSGRSSRIERIVGFEGDLREAVAGQSVTLVLADELDCARGDLIAAATAPPPIADGLAADLVWMSEQPLSIGRAYWLKAGTRTVAATVARVDHVVDINRLEQRAGQTLALNDIGRCILALDQALPAIPYDEDRALGGFILIDRLTNATVAAGMVRAHARRETAPGGAAAPGERIFWIRGASVSERAATAARLRDRFRAAGAPAFILDERMLRAGLNSDLGEGARAEHLRRAREVARLMSMAGTTVLIALDAGAGEMTPGRVVGADDLEAKGADQWVI